MILDKITRTDDNWTSLILRVVLGLVMFPHGAQKLLGWFGGGGVAGTVQFLGSIGIPSVVSYLVIAIEFFGSLALLAGAFGRLAALGVGVVMFGAVSTVHFGNGFFMNWSGAQAGEGFEYHLLVFAIVAVLAMRGSGAYSVDRILTKQRVGS